MRRRQSSIFFTSVPRGGSFLFLRPASANEFSRQLRSLPRQEMRLAQFPPPAPSRPPPRQQVRQESKRVPAVKFQIRSPAAILLRVERAEPGPVNSQASLRAPQLHQFAKLNKEIRW